MSHVPMIPWKLILYYFVNIFDLVCHFISLGSTKKNQKIGYISKVIDQSIIAALVDLVQSSEMAADVLLENEELAAGFKK